MLVVCYAIKMKHIQYGAQITCAHENYTHVCLRVSSGRQNRAQTPPS